MKYKSEFDAIYESVLSAFGDEIGDPNSPTVSSSLTSDTPEVSAVEIEIVQGDSLEEIAKKLGVQVKGLRKVASKNTDGGKIYYRTRNIVKLVDQLKTALGVPVDSEEDDTQSHYETPASQEKNKN